MRSLCKYGWLLLALASCASPSNETVYQGACYSADCAGDSCADTFVDAGTPCLDGFTAGAGAFCDGKGNCVECLTESDCPQGNGCVSDIFTCTNGRCEDIAPPQYCVNCADAGDCPPQVCDAVSCLQGICEYSPVDAGTPCASGDSNVCDGNGTCLECVKDSDCLPEGPCTRGACTAHLCGVAPANTGDACATGFVCDDHGSCSVQPCSDGVKDYGETDIDCGGTFCGNAGITCNQGQSCVTGSDCTSMSCVAGVCAAPRCGDGVVTVAVGEQCDPPGPGCSADCQLTNGTYVGDQGEVPDNGISLKGVSGAVGLLNRVGTADNYFYSPLSGCDGGTVRFSLDDGFGNCPSQIAQNAQLSVNEVQTCIADITKPDGGCEGFEFVACDSFFVTVSAPEQRVVPYYVLEVVRTSP